MSPKGPSQSPLVLDRFALERRRFLSEGAAYGVGSFGILAGLGLSQYARAQTAAPGATGPGGPAAAGPSGGPGSGGPPGAGPGGPPGRPPLPPEPAVSQPAPLSKLKGKVAYITASSDGIGLGIARAASNAGMKVCIGYRNEERLKAALPLFKKNNAGILPVMHDVTDRDGWAKTLEKIKSEDGR